MSGFYEDKSSETVKISELLSYHPLIVLTCLERQQKAKLFLAENVKAYMETVKQDNVGTLEREKKYVRSR